MHSQLAEQNRAGQRQDVAVVVASALGTRCAMTRELAVVLMPLVSPQVLQGNGNTVQRPFVVPRSISASATRAAAMKPLSGSTVM